MQDPDALEWYHFAQMGADVLQYVSFLKFKFKITSNTDSCKKAEQELAACPLCGSSDLQSKWCYPLAEAAGYNSLFNPVRL